jgi:hypothetical protein
LQQATIANMLKIRSSSTILTLLMPGYALFMLQLCYTCADAASSLSRLWKQSAHAKLLQRQPAERISAKQAALFEQSFQETAELGLCLDELLKLQLQEDNREEDIQLILEETLAARPVAMLAQLLVWLQQRPELLQLPEQAADTLAPAQESSYCKLWSGSIQGASVKLS